MRGQIGQEIYPVYGLKMRGSIRALPHSRSSRFKKQQMKRVIRKRGTYYLIERQPDRRRHPVCTL